MSDEPDDRDLSAGAYVIGLMEPDEAHALEQQAEQDPALAASIDNWRNRLAPMAAAVRPVPPPPTLWRRIETTLGLAAPPVMVATVAAASAATPVPSATRLRRRLRFWRSATAAGLALAAAFAGLAYVERQTPPQFTASLGPVDAPKPAFLAQFEPDGSLLVRPLASIPVQSGKDSELWALAAGDKAPKSLGVLPAIGRRMRVPGFHPAGTQLLISLEPAGGSPTGAPTGPVLYGGTLEQLN